jgi:rod shape determining protein RodA
MLNITHRYVMKKPGFLSKYRLDGWLLLNLFVLMCLGCLVLYSAKQDLILVERQILRFGMATLLMIGVAQIPPPLLRPFAPWIYGIGVGLLACVLLLGDVSKGAQRWLNLGILRFQPAEILKIAVPLFLAHYLSARELPPKISTSFIALAFIAVPALLVAKQPDLGTAILIGSTGFVTLFFAGISFRFLSALAALGLSALPIIWYFMHDYQRQRVLTLLNPEADPLGTGYHIIQSKIAIGSGGIFGRGWLQGTQSQLDFLPERSTDFIFAVLGEEFGLVGVLILLLTYLLLLGRGFWISVQAPDGFSRLLAGSITSALFIYVFVNIGMVTGLLPVVGVPLPLMSYGGSSMVTLMTGFGILMSIATHKRLLPG